MAELRTVLNQMGFRVLEVPEASSVLRKGGINLGDDKRNLTQSIKFHKTLMKLQMRMEQIFIDIA